MLRASSTITDHGSLMIDWIDNEGRIYAVNDYEARELGIEFDNLAALPPERIYSSASAQLVRAIAKGEHKPDAAFLIWVNSPAFKEVAMLASVLNDAPNGIAIVKQVLPTSALGIDAELNERIEILSQMIGAATEACWCIEFLEPVDMSLAEEEIVDRVFGNQSRWRACNDAMARLYRVPDGLDFNTQPVSRYFPDNDINRQMVRELVRSNYRLDHAAAVDRRHDGSEMQVENDFRAAIKDGLLIRLWGTTRDVGPSRKREQQLSDRAENMLDVLSAMPDPILVISEDGLVLAANPATETAWGRAAEQILGRPIQHFVETRNAAEKLRQAALDEEDGTCDLGMIAFDDSRESWRFHAALMEGEVRRYVVTARRKARRRPRTLLSEVAS